MKFFSLFKPHFFKQSVSLLVSFSLLSSQTALAIENVANNIPNPSNVPTNPANPNVDIVNNIPTPNNIPNPSNIANNLPNIIIDNSLQSSNPTLDQSRNGIDIINIANPNQAGISNNFYKEFNVSQKGLIFNNSKELITPTQLAGLINGNIHLKDKEAQLILNQVTGNNISQLLGFMEIAGKQAQLIIANPNGITCKGCGFINSSSSTLTTGSISLEELNRLNHLKDLNNHLNLMVQRGHINIEALNASNIPILNLISESLSVNQDLLANKLNIILGKNKIDLDLSKNASILLYEPIDLSSDLNDNNNNNLKDSHKQTKTALALDVAYLGSVLAKSIYLVATSEGIGVKNSGRIATFASEKEGDGGFVIDVNGKVEISKPKEAYEAYKKNQELKVQEQLAKQQEQLAKQQEQLAQQDLQKQEEPFNPNNYKTTDTPKDDFTPPLIASNSNLSIKAKAIENQSIITAKGNLDIQADDVKNIGSLELENLLISKIHHSSRCEDESKPADGCGSDKKHTLYDYDKIITEDHLKPNTYDPAIISAKNIHIKAKNLTNDSSILYAEETSNLEVENLLNKAPTPKRVERREGKKTEHDRHGDCTPLLGKIDPDTFCHTTNYTSYYNKVDGINSIPLDLPLIDLASLEDSHHSLIEDSLASATFNYTQESHPLYTSKDIFINTDVFKDYLYHSFIPANPVADIQGLLDSSLKNNQFLIHQDKSLFGSRKNLELALSWNAKKIPNSSFSNNPLASSSLSDTNSNDSKSSNSRSSDSTSDDSTSSNSVSNDSTSDDSNSSSKSKKYKFATTGIYGNDILIASSDFKNTSNLKGKNVALKSKFLLNQNGTIMANNDWNDPARDSLAANDNSKLSFKADTFKNISAKLQGGITSIDAKEVTIESGTNKTESSYTAPVSKMLSLMGFKPKPAYTSENVSLDALASVDTNKLFINGESVAIKGANLNAKDNINISASKLDISTAKLSDEYSDSTQSHSYTTNLASQLSAKNISLNTSGDLHLTSAKLNATDDIALNASGNIHFDTAQNSSMTQVTTTTYAEGDAKKFDFTSTTTTTTTTESSTTHLANQLSAKNVSIHSGSSIEAYNLNIDSNNKVSMNAKDNLTISNKADTHSKTIESHQKKSGLSFSSSGDSYSVSLGVETEDISDKTSSSTHHNQDIKAASIELVADKKASIESSNLVASNDISINAADVSISSLQDSSTHEREEKHTSNKIGFSMPKAYVDGALKSTAKSGVNLIGLKKQANKIDAPFVSQIDHIEFSVGFKHTDKTTNTNSSNSIASSSNLSANNIHINAKNKADIIGSNLEAQNDIHLSAKTLNIAAASNESSSSDSMKANEASLKVSANIGKDTSLSGEASFNHSESKDSTYHITHTASNLSSKNLHINTLEDTTIVGSQLNASDNTSIQAQSFHLLASKDSSNSHTSNSGYGGKLKVSYQGSFGGEISGNYNDRKTDTSSITHNASVLNTSNLSVKTTGDTTIEGSTLNATQASIDARSLEVLASKDSYSHSEKSNAYSASIGGSLSNLASLNAGGNIAKSSKNESSLTHQNASINVNNLNLNTSQDVHIKGGNISTQNLEANIGGNLNVESLQNSYRYSEDGLKLGASVSKSSFKPSFGVSPANFESSKVGTQSGISSQNKLDMNVMGNTDLKGGFINASSSDSYFTTQSLSHSDIENISKVSYSRGIEGSKNTQDTSKTLATISKNISLHQNTPTPDNSITRDTPVNEKPKEFNIPKQGKSVFDTLMDLPQTTSKAINKGANLIDGIKSATNDYQKNQTKDKNNPKSQRSNPSIHHNKSFGEKAKEATIKAAKQTAQITDKAIDVSYHYGLDFIDSLTDIYPTQKAKQFSNNANHYTAFTYHIKDISKGALNIPSQSVKQNFQDFKSAMKPLSDPLINIGVNNAKDTLTELVKNMNRTGENKRAPKNIFKEKWDNTQTQSMNAWGDFTHQKIGELYQ